MEKRYLYHMSATVSRSPATCQDPPQQSTPVRIPDKDMTSRLMSEFVKLLESTGAKVQGPNPTGMYRVTMPDGEAMTKAKSDFMPMERERRNYVHITENGYGRCVPVFGILHAVTPGTAYFLWSEVDSLEHPDLSVGREPDQPKKAARNWADRPVLKKN